MNIKSIINYIIIFSSLIIFSISACNNEPNSPQKPPKKLLPDLAFTGRYDFKFERTLPPTGNDLYTLSVEIKNQGSTPCPSVQVIAHSKGPGIEGNRPPLENNGYYAVDVGQMVEAKFQFIFEKQFSGEYEFVVTADPSNGAHEANEANNRFVFKRKF